jgi:hypothetical protein
VKQETELERKLWDVLCNVVDEDQREFLAEGDEWLEEIAKEQFIRGLSGLDPELLEDEEKTE